MILEGLFLKKPLPGISGKFPACLREVPE